MQARYASASIPRKELFMSDEAVAALIRTHVKRYPTIEIQDVYKLLHQAVFGPGHAITNQRATRDWLERESELLIPVYDEALLENIHPQGQIVRVHLRPYLAARGNLEKLLDGYIRSSAVVQGDIATMAAWWDIFRRMTEGSGPLASRFSARTVSLVGRTRASENWPASHHSPAYDQTYKPAYRVLTLPIAEALLKAQKITYNVI
jgi:hypothetical protein